MHSDTEAGAAGARITVVLVLLSTHRLQPLGQNQGVAVVTSNGDAITASRRIPSRFGPFDGRAVGHTGHLQSVCLKRLRHRSGQNMSATSDRPTKEVKIGVNSA